MTSSERSCALLPFCPSAFLFFRIYLETSVSRIENTFRVSVWNLKWMTHWQLPFVEVSRVLTFELEELRARIGAACTCLRIELPCRLFLHMWQICLFGCLSFSVLVSSRKEGPCSMQLRYYERFHCIWTQNLTNTQSHVSCKFKHFFFRPTCSLHVKVKIRFSL